MKSFKVDDFTMRSYAEFLSVKRAPIHRVVENILYYEDFEDAAEIGQIAFAPHLFDYQEFITRLALAKKRYAVFADVGLGKTAIFLEWVRHVSKMVYPKKVLIISQLHLIRQTLDEQMKFYGWTNISDINRDFGGDIQAFCAVENGQWEGLSVGIVNVDKFNRKYRLQDSVGAVVLDDSGCPKDETSVRRTNIIESCKGIEFKLCCTATPAPNDRQEYANHALHLGYIDNYKQFFTKYFYNTGSGNDFVLKPHARKAFYEFLSTWSIFLKSPARYGFSDNLHDLKPAQVIWDSIGLTDGQRTAAIKYGAKGQMGMWGVNAGGITNRNKLSQIAKGFVYERSSAN
ncbi:MAG: hypothetical protein WC455_20610 [Dehalococcoidia bacterium]|jgi:hypothetical protein